MLTLIEQVWLDYLAGRERALTLPELMLLNALRVRERTKEDVMVQKVAGFGEFIGLADEFAHPDWDDMSATLAEVKQRLAAGRELAKQNITNAVAAVDKLDAFNAAFGNGPPSPGSSQPPKTGSPPQNPP